MKHTIQFECMDKECNTVIIGTNRQDGISCPRCNGPVLAKPFVPKRKISDDAFYVRSEILRRNKKHCFDLTAEQVESVLEIYKGRKVSKLTIPVEVTGLDKIQQVIQILKDISNDERIPVAVREEVLTKLYKCFGVECS